MILRFFRAVWNLTAPLASRMGLFLIVAAIPMAFIPCDTVSSAAVIIATSGTGLLIFATFDLGVQQRKDAQEVQKKESTAREKIIASADRQIAWYDAQLEEARERPFGKFFEKAEDRIKQESEKALAGIAAIMSAVEKYSNYPRPDERMAINVAIREHTGQEPGQGAFQTLDYLLNAIRDARKRGQEANQFWNDLNASIKSNINAIRITVKEAFAGRIRQLRTDLEQELRLLLEKEVVDHHLQRKYYAELSSKCDIHTIHLELTL